MATKRRKPVKKGKKLQGGKLQRKVSTLSAFKLMRRMQDEN